MELKQSRNHCGDKITRYNYDQRRGDEGESKKKKRYSLRFSPLNSLRNPARANGVSPFWVFLGMMVMYKSLRFLCIRSKWL
jgi:hypothetical protein